MDLDILIRNRDEALAAFNQAHKAELQAEEDYYSVTGETWTLKRHTEVEALLRAARQTWRETIPTLLGTESDLARALKTLAGT